MAGLARTTYMNVGRKIRPLAIRLFRNSDLCLLNRTLAAQQFSSKYRIACGTLLGWARENRPIRWDPDADFFLMHTDLPEFLTNVVPSLKGAGFRTIHMFRGNDGRITEVSFRRRLARYDFFVIYPGSTSSEQVFYTYTWTPEATQISNPFVAQPWEPCQMLGESWLKPRDHEAELEAQYGNWRTPNKAYNYTEARNVRQQTPWLNSDTSWRLQDSDFEISRVSRPE